MPASVRLEPHPVSKSLVLRVADLWDPTQEDVKIPREAVPSEGEDAIGTTIYLTDPDVQWRELRIQLEAELPAIEIDKVLPKTSSVKEDAGLIVSTQNPSSKLRRVTRLEPTAPGRWRGDVLIRRDEVRDSVRLVARLVRATHLVGKEDAARRYASYQGAVIAEAPVLAFVLDERRRPEGVLRIKWEDFRTSSNTWLAEHPADIFYLDPQGRHPTLWLNKRYEKLRAALKSRTVRGEEAVIRHLANAVLAQTVWAHLFVVALAGAEVIEEDAGVDEPSEPWKQAVLRKLLPRAFPDIAADDRLTHALSQLRSPDLVGSLISRLGTAVQDVVGTHLLIEKAIRAAEAKEVTS